MKDLYFPLSSDSVAYTVSAGTIDPVAGAHIHVVRIVTTTDAYISFTGTATTADMYIPADVPELFVIHPGQAVSAIRDTADGTLHVTYMTR